MATANSLMEIPDIHSTAGARWIAPFMAVIFLVLLGLFAMLVYPHITR
jgi:hypothetical protein